MTKPITDVELLWHIRKTIEPHYACEHKQDNTERKTVKCHGCLHSSESARNAESALLDFIKSYAKDYAEQREANVRHDIAALAPPCEHGLDDKDHKPYCGFINNIWQNWASKNGMTWKPDEIRAEQRERMQ